MGAKVVNIPMNGYSTDMKGIANAVTDRTKLVWVCNPNNPTGTVIDPESLEKFFMALPEDAWVVLDEAYAEFASPEELPDRARLISEGKNLVSVRTFSKAYGLAGARLGYGMAREKVVTAIDTVSEPFNANRLGIAAGVAVLTRDREACERARALILTERERVSQHLQAMGMSVVPSRTNFIFFDTPFHAENLAEELLYRGVIVRPCGGWGYQGAIRVTVGTEEENDIFLAALKETVETMREKDSGTGSHREVEDGPVR